MTDSTTSQNDDLATIDLSNAESPDEMLRLIHTADDGLALPGEWPSFGGDEPPDDFVGAAADSRVILSWDPERLLIGTWGGDGSDCEIVSRKAWAGKRTE